MIEILILYILLPSKNTLYGIQKIIKDKFIHLNSATFGSLHPAVERLLKKGFVIDKKTLSDGGRKKNTYSITKEGKEYLFATLRADFSPKTSGIERQIALKLACSDILDVQLRKELYTKTVRYYEYRVAVLQKLLKNKDYSDMQLEQIHLFIKNYESQINLLGNFLD